MATFTDVQSVIREHHNAALATPGGMSTEVVNLTPHVVVVRHADGRHSTFAPSGKVARCAEVRTAQRSIVARDRDDLPIGVTLAAFGAVDGLPAPLAGTIFVVSALVLAAVSERADVFAPGAAIRDEAGKVVACDGLSCTPAYAALHKPTPPAPNDDDADYDPLNETAPSGGSEYFDAPRPARCDNRYHFLVSVLSTNPQDLRGDM